jgi:hypothetical protein
VTGVQIHNWGQQFDSAEPNFDYIAPASTYVVKGGKRTNLDISTMPVRRLCRTWMCPAVEEGLQMDSYC